MKALCVGKDCFTMLSTEWDWLYGFEGKANMPHPLSKKCEHCRTDAESSALKRWAKKQRQRERRLQDNNK